MFRGRYPDFVVGNPSAPLRHVPVFFFHSVEPVEFEARLLVDGRVEAMHENSNFVRQQGRWLYTDGETLAPSLAPWKPGRNEPCPCGSGKKFKRCCA